MRVPEVRVDYYWFKFTCYWTSSPILVKKLLPLEVLFVCKLDIGDRQHVNQFCVLDSTKHIVGLELINRNLIKLSDAPSYPISLQKPLANGAPCDPLARRLVQSLPVVFEGTLITLPSHFQKKEAILV